MTSELEGEVAEFIKGRIQRGLPPYLGTPASIIQHCREAVAKSEPKKGKTCVDWSCEVDLETWEGFHILRKCGVPFCTIEAWKLSHCIHLLKKEKCTAKFWGKIFRSRDKCYFIAEVSEIDASIKYFCLEGLEGSWQPLSDPPNVQTGEFQEGLPADGTESEYLYEIVSRISSETRIEKRFEGSDLSGIVHVIPGHPEVALRAFRRALNTHRDTNKISRKTLDKDEKGSWTVTYVGDPNLYVNCEHEDTDVFLGCILISSNAWPGAYCILSGFLGRSINFYIGDGCRPVTSRNTINDPLCKSNSGKQC